MSAREIVVLGTSSQVPTRTRNHHAAFLAWDDLGILFDPGEGTQRQMLHAGIPVSRITHICITHFHGDHCLGLAGICQRISLDQVPHPVQVLYPASGQVYFERLRHASIYWEQATVVPRPIAAPGEVARSGTFRIEAGPLDHAVECFGYRVVEDDGRRMLPDRLAESGIAGARVGELLRAGSLDVGGRTVTVADVSVPRPGQRFAFVMDTRLCDGARALADGADLMVCEATYLAAETAEAAAHGHLTAAQAAGIARDAGVRRLALTHFSQRYLTLDGFREEAGALHPDVVVCEDLTRVPVPPRAGQ